MRVPVEVDGETLIAEAVAREIAGAAGGGRGAATKLLRNEDPEALASRPSPILGGTGPATEETMANGAFPGAAVLEQAPSEQQTAGRPVPFPLERNHVDDRQVPWDQASRALARLVRESDRPPVVFLEGGHFDPRFGADPFSKASLDAALGLGSRLIRTYSHRVRLVFGILQDDLGLDCGGASCTLGVSPPGALETALPAELEARLAGCRFVKRDRVEVFRERAAKNRGINRLKRILAEGGTSFLYQEEDGEETRILFHADDGERVLIARRRGAGWVASCPLIMAQHYADVVSHLERRFSPSAPLLLIDYSQNADRNKVVRGSELSLRLLMADAPAPRRIINVFFADELGRHALAADFDREDFVLLARAVSSGGARP